MERRKVHLTHRRRVPPTEAARALTARSGRSRPAVRRRQAAQARAGRPAGIRASNTDLWAVEQRPVVARREEQEHHPVDAAIALLQGETSVERLKVVRAGLRLDADPPWLAGRRIECPGSGHPTPAGRPATGMQPRFATTSDRWQTRVEPLQECDVRAIADRLTDREESKRRLKTQHGRDRRHAADGDIPGKPSLDSPVLRPRDAYGTGNGVLRQTAGRPCPLELVGCRQHQSSAKLRARRGAPLPDRHPPRVRAGP